MKYKLTERFIRHGAFRKLRVFLFVGIIVLLAWYVSTYWYQLMLIQGESMAPTYHNWQLVLLNKHCSSSEIERGDVVAFECADLSSVLVKRVVALPGDTVEIKDKLLYVNGEVSPLYEKESFSYAGILQDELVVATDCFIVIGDNVSQSMDSRYEQVGAVGAESIIGVVK